MGWQDHYKTLAFKTLAFWQLVIEQYNARYIIKVDDDNYVRLDRLAIAVRQWEDIGAGAAPSLAGSHTAVLRLAYVPEPAPISLSAHLHPGA